MSNPKPLDDLLGEAKSHAEFTMRHAGSIPPTMFAMTPEGLLQFLPARFDAKVFTAFSQRNISRAAPMLLALCGEGEARVLPRAFEDAEFKDRFANACRMICVAYSATAVVLLLESSVMFGKDGGPLDDPPPSEAADRKEFVLLAGEAEGTAVHELLPIIRTGAGGFFGFGRFDSSRFDAFQGRFSEILPPKKLDKQMREIAQVALKAMGVTRISLRPKPREELREAGGMAGASVGGCDPPTCARGTRDL